MCYSFPCLESNYYWRQSGNRSSSLTPCPVAPNFTSCCLSFHHLLSLLPTSLCLPPNPPQLPLILVLALGILEHAASVLQPGSRGGRGMVALTPALGPGQSTTATCPSCHLLLDSKTRGIFPCVVWGKKPHLGIA